MFMISANNSPNRSLHLPSRLHQPRKEVLEGKWTFPDVKPVQ